MYQFTTIYNNCFPLKRKKATRKNCLRKPWITGGLLKSIKKKIFCIKGFLTIQLLIAHNAIRTSRTN